MAKDTYRLFIRDLIYLLKENIDEHQESDDFSLGVKQGYSEIVDLIESQADAFNIDLKKIGFNDFENYKNNNNVG